MIIYRISTVSYAYYEHILFFHNSCKRQLLLAIFFGLVKIQRYLIQSIAHDSVVNSLLM